MCTISSASFFARVTLTKTSSNFLPPPPVSLSITFYSASVRARTQQFVTLSRRLVGEIGARVTGGGGGGEEEVMAEKKIRLAIRVRTPFVYFSISSTPRFLRRHVPGQLLSSYSRQPPVDVRLT